MQSRSLTSALVLVGQRQDLVLVALIVAAIMMMILPLPTWIVDVLIAINMAFTVLLLMVVIYLKRPVDMPVLPAVILISTVFRLALAITTTRLILLQADAGRIVETFGNFVVAGSLVVGLIVFLIITVVQFVVITKGAERVAEVGARFTLDAIPGKQMSIDAELRNGDISRDEARERRQLLERESQLYGAMDGAMKFVKGDAIAGLVIIAINLFGGIIIGTAQLGLSFAEATQIYSLLTVGDGLVAQIPALFVSIAASVVVTRVSYEGSVNLGADIASHLLGSVRPLELAAAVVFLLGFVPGFPTPIFTALAALFIGVALVRRFKSARTVEAAIDPRGLRLEGVRPIRVRLTQRAIEGWGPGEVRAVLGERMQRLGAELGVPLPMPELAIESASSPHDVTIEVEEVPVARRALLDGPVADSPPSERRSHSPSPVLELWGRRERKDPQKDPALARAGDILEDAVRRHIAVLVGLEQTKQVLDAARQSNATLVDETLRQLPVPKFCHLFRQMLADGLTLRHHRSILETVAALAADGSNIPALVDHVRVGLKRQLTYAHCSVDGRIHAILLPAPLEETLRGSIQDGRQGTFSEISAAQAREIVNLVKHSRETAPSAAKPVVLTHFEIRRHIAGLLGQHDLPVPVLAYDEIAPGFEINQLPAGQVCESSPFDWGQPQTVAAQ